MTTLEEDDETLASFSIALLLALLMTAMLIGYLLRQHRINYLQEAGVALMMGVLTGYGVNKLRGDDNLKWISFQPKFFFLFLLPPIIFDSGFGLNMKAFFRNFPAICMFAFFGTFVSALVFGLIVFYAGKLGICYQLPMLEALIFGSLISATDPVTVLAIFHSLRVEPKMYSLVFGESVLNDAVAIVLYRSLLSFKGQSVTVTSCLKASAQFLTIFVGSFGIGTAVALSSSLLFKKASFRRAQSTETDSTLQVAIAVLFPFVAYMIAEGLALSGIVAILFTGVVMAHYTSKNLPPDARNSLKSFFRVLASLAETFIFIYIGAEVFLANQTWHHISLTGISFVAVLVARVFNIFPGSLFLNLCTRNKDKRIPLTYQKMLWFSGLRGGIAFALALECFKDIPENHAQAILNATLVIIMFTVVVNGGLAVAALKGLKIQMGYSEHTTMNEISFQQVGTEEEGLETQGSIAKKLRKMESIRRLQAYMKAWKYHSSFEAIDRKYLMPFFTMQAQYGESGSYKKMNLDMELTDQNPNSIAEKDEGKNGDMEK